MDYFLKVILVIFLIFSVDARPQTFTGFENANISGGTNIQGQNINSSSTTGKIPQYLWHW